MRKEMHSNKALQWSEIHRGRHVLAMDGVLAGPEWTSCSPAERNR